MESRWIGKWKKIDENYKFWKKNKLVMAIIHEDDGATNDLCQQIP